MDEQHIITTYRVGPDEILIVTSVCEPRTMLPLNHIISLLWEREGCETQVDVLHKPDSKCVVINNAKVGQCF